MNGWFVANLHNYPELRRVADRPEIAVVSVIFVLIFACPSFLGVLQWLGMKRGVLLLCALAFYAVSVETFALHTGWPYGRFVYGEKIGAKLPGGVPWTVCFAWSPLLLCAMTISSALTIHTQADEKKRPRAALSPDLMMRCGLAATLLVLFDCVLDPGAVSQGYWRYAAGGFFYNVPLTNFVGWLLSGIGGAWLFSVWTRDAAPPGALMRSGLLILLFWTAVCGWSHLRLAFLAGVIALTICFHVYFQENCYA